MTRLRGCRAGESAPRRQGPAGSSGRPQLSSPALRNDRINDAPCLFDGPINGERFHAYVEQFLVPTLKPGDVVILDNLGSQKRKGGAEGDPGCREAASRLPAEILARPQSDRAGLRQSSKLCCERRGARSYEAISDAPAAKSSPNTRPPNAPHASRTQDTRRPKSRTLSRSMTRPAQEFEFSMVLRVSLQHVEAPIVQGNWGAREFHLIRILRVLATASVIALGGCKTTYLEQRTDQPPKRRRHHASCRFAAAIPRADRAPSTLAAQARPNRLSFYGSATPAPTPRAQRARARISRGCGGRRGATPPAEFRGHSRSECRQVGPRRHPGRRVCHRSAAHRSSITLSSGRPIAREDMLFVLEKHAAREQPQHGLRDPSGYRIVPANDGGIGAIDRRRGFRRRGARIRYDRYPTGICLWSDPGQYD